MSRRELIDPEVRPPLEELLRTTPGGFNAIADLGERRATLERLLAGADTPADPRVTIEDRTVPGPAGEPGIRVRVYRPAGADGELPGIYYVHSGGMIMGSVEAEDGAATMLCAAVQAVVVSVEYRLAPEFPYPAGVEDCYAGLAWVGDHTRELGIDPHRLAVFGMSSGGGLAVATALLARDRRGPRLAFLMPIYPMLDDRNATESSYEICDIGIWDRSANVEAWAWYLNGKPADQYAAPARAVDVKGLPPTFMDVGTVDLFRDEDIDFAQRLMGAGVPLEMHIHSGAYHAAEVFAPESALAHRIWSLRIDALKRALAVTPRRDA
ncbi:alpha/beta hydrolase [Symbioplanes lichenis]|uniref:alpha/beta hydrolase n=1 Tax=Symbioplanes lichenis TaxID=1629072 RepID=UPI00273A4144|nr:alpha/beta hydrolase [Actinoplanes lichenis]